MIKLSKMHFLCRRHEVDKLVRKCIMIGCKNNITHKYTINLLLLVKIFIKEEIPSHTMTVEAVMPPHSLLLLHYLFLSLRRFFITF